MEHSSTALTPKIYVLLLKQDDPHKCTAARLAKFRLATPLFRMKQIRHKSIVLNPFASKTLLARDNELAAKNGLVAIDCSWEKVENVFTIQSQGQARRLPLLLASNPVNYAKAHKLSSAEALAAALYIMGFKDKAKDILAKFKWGPGFLTLNAELLESYAAATTEDDLLQG